MRVLEMHGGTIHEARLIRDVYLGEPRGYNTWGATDSKTIKIVSATPAERRALRRAGFCVADATPPATRVRRTRRHA